MQVAYATLSKVDTEQAIKTKRGGSRCKALLFLLISALDGQRHAPDALPRERYQVPIVQEAGWAPGPVWTGAENIASTGIRFQDHPARSESLYRLSYPGNDSIEMRNRISR